MTGATSSAAAVGTPPRYILTRRQGEELLDRPELETARAALGEEAFAAAWAIGERLSLEELAALAQEPVEEGQ